MQNKNLFFFCLLAILIFLGYMQLQALLYPVRPKPHPPEPPVRLPQPGLWASLPADVGAIAGDAPGGAGLAGAVRLAASAGTLSKWSAGQPVALAKKEPEKPPEPKIVPKPEPEPAAQHREIVMGDASEDSRFNMKVILTSKGAGVQSLTLNKFAQADRLGRPDGNPPRRLELIPNNPKAPSSLLYHYAPPVDGHPNNPVDTLGLREWSVVKAVTAPNAPVQEVVFQTTVPHQDVTITKTYTLEPGTYHLGLSLQFERKKTSPGPVAFRYELAGAHGLPIEGEWYTTVYRNALIGQVDENHRLWRDLQDSRTIGFQAGGREVPRGENRIIRYAAVATQFFASVIVVDNHQDPGVKEDFLAWARPTLEGTPDPAKQFLDDITVRVISEPLDLKPGVPVTHRYLLYNGPVKVRLLSHLDGDKAVASELVDRYEQESQLGLNTLTDYGNFGFWSTLLIACTNLMHGLLFYLHRYVMPFSYGLCIILLTVMVRGTMFPVSRRQAASQAKVQEKMQEIAPEIKKLEAKYANDKMALQQAKNELYLKKGINPLAMLSSCWMVFAQMPIFLGLYYALQESIHFRLAPFLWIKNLAAPDMLIWWTENIPLISRPDGQGGFLYLGPYFNLLPIIAVALMIVQQKMLTPPPTDDQQAMQQSMMKYMMIVFGIMFYKVAAGLCIYFIASSLWGLTERKLLPKRKLATAAGASGNGQLGAAPARGPAAVKRSRSRDGQADDGKLVRRVKDLWDKLLKEARKK
jgi:YidC/Oxa1 family membrane protein insertase